MAKKNVLAIVKIQIPAGAASPAPPSARPSAPTAWRSWTSARRTTSAPRTSGGRSSPSRSRSTRTARSRSSPRRPPTSVLLRTAAGLEKAAENPGREEVGSITDAQLTEIAETKLPDLTANDLGGGEEDRGRHRPVHGDQGRPRRLDPTPACGRTSPGPVPKPTHEREPSWRKARSTRTPPRRFDRQRQHTPPRRSALVKSLASAKLRRDRRAGRAPRRRPPQGRRDAPRHRGPALGHRP